MTVYELMIKTNHHLIKGGAAPLETLLTDAQKSNIVRQLLAARSDERTKQNFYRGVKYPRNKDENSKGRMYPEYFIPPYNNGKKLQTVIPMAPKTHILSANAYELEIIRLLCLFAPDNSIVKDMVKGTLERLKTSCPGNDCAQGECFHSSLPVLRLLAVAASDETAWIHKLMTKFNRHIDEKLSGKNRIHGNVLWYYWLCLSELPFEIAEPEIIRYKERIIVQLSRSSVMNNESDRINHPVMICAIRNALARLPEYAHIKNRRPYINEKDGRLYFDMNERLI